MRLLANPLFMRSAAVLLSAIAAFVAAVVLMRILRRRILEDDVLSDGLENQDTSFAYSTVIQQLKQQKFALQHEQKEQQRRTKTSEQVAGAVIAHLPCGVLLVAQNGLIKQANPAARQILGFASPLGMNLNEVFRGAKAVSDSGRITPASELVNNALHGQPSATAFETHYETPSGDSKSLKIRIVALHSPSGDDLGIACVITDESAAATRRQSDLLRSEIAAEMALELHTSLATIRECAGRLAIADDRALARSLANDIAVESERLGKAVGGFLAAGQDNKAMAARA
jgi:nitrogen fixation/metabolism regulation signal transduction histidine kinase